jgi:hypothetical protein
MHLALYTLYARQALPCYTTGRANAPANLPYKKVTKMYNHSSTTPEAIAIYYVLFVLKQHANKGPGLSIMRMARHTRVRTYVGSRAAIQTVLDYCADQGWVDSNVANHWIVTDDGLDAFSRNVYSAGTHKAGSK